MTAIQRYLRGKRKCFLESSSLILVDTYNKKVFCILLTRQYVAELHVNGKTTKRIYFNDSDEFNNDKFITELLKYNKILNTNTLVPCKGQNYL